MGYHHYGDTLGIGEPRHPLYARPQAPRLLRQHHPQNKVRPELRDRIRLYQNECDDALWNYWTKGHATRKPKTALPVVPQPTRQEQTAAALERFRTFRREFFKVGSELEHCLRDAY